MNKRTLLWLILAGLLLALLGWNHLVELRAEEPRRAIVSMEMVLSGNYWVPHINGWTYYNKPPVFNWLMAAFFQIFGSFDEWVVRLPALLSFLLMAGLNFFLVRRFVDNENAILSSFFILTSADLLFYGTVNAGEIDLFFSLLVGLQVGSFFVFYQRKQYLLMFILSYFFAALGTLTKGPPSVAFQALTVVPWLLWHREWRLLFSWQHWLSGFAFLGLVGGYFYYYDQFDDGLSFAVRLFKEASQRTGLEHSFGDTLLGLVEFPGFLAKLMFPWFLFLVFWWRKDWWEKIKAQPWLKFCAIFLLFNLPLYWFAGDHKSRYLYMFVPAFCVLFSYFYLLGRATHPRLHRFFSLFFKILIALGTLAFIAAPFLPQTADITGIIWKSIGIVLAGAAIFYHYQKNPSLQIYSFILFLALMRIGMNLTYLPLIDQTTEKTYQAHVTEILQRTNHQAVHWNGPVHRFTSDASIGPLTFSEVELQTAPLIAYQIPYYLTKGNGHIMQFDETRQSGQYYLAPKDWVAKDKVTVLYHFRERWQQLDLVLFQEK